jgi:hypothetical protein
MAYRATLVLTALLALATAPTKADITRDFLGTWKVHTVGQKEVGNLRIWKERDGTIRERSTARIPGLGTIKLENWHYRNGRTKGHTYLGRRKIETVTGTWRAVGKKIRINTAATNHEDGFRYKTSGYLLRVNRNKWTFYLQATSKAGRRTLKGYYLRVR